ncbi:MAG: hypothetical protein M3178_06870 [Pseudomonadota bacterium]|nr:hypothetical protein [Pseudomonadota bacterium]
MSVTEIEGWLKLNAVPLSLLLSLIVFLTNLWKRVDYSKDIRKQRIDLIDKLRSQFDDEETVGYVFDALDDYRSASRVMTKQVGRRDQGTSNKCRHERQILFYWNAWLYYQNRK